ncbi:MAG: universal stress protein [Azospirillaceae bacterium]
MSTEEAQAGAPANEDVRVFLIVVDDTEEWRAALRFACRRAQHTGGRVALMHVIEPADFQHWMAVEEVMRAEMREEAETRLHSVAEEVVELTGQMPILHIREGTTREELLALINEEPSISILVLGAHPGAEGPGPLIQYLTTKGLGRLRVPITIVPGNLDAEAIDGLA